MLEQAMQQNKTGALLIKLIIQSTYACGRYYGKPIFLSGGCHTTCCPFIF
jgi:hypothetical protein